MTGVELAVEVLIAQAVNKARRAGGRLDSVSDEVVDVAADPTWNLVRDLVLSKLSRDPVLKKLETEVANTGQVGTRTRLRVILAVEAAADDDDAFAVQLQSALAAAQGGTVVSGTVTASGLGGITIGSVGRDITLNPDLDSEDGVPPRRGGPTS